MTNTSVVREFMTHNPRTVQPNSIVKIAAKIMSDNEIRHLVVTDHDGHLCGVLSQRDMLKHIADCYNNEKRPGDSEVWEFMEAAVLTATPETPIVEAARMMTENKLGCLPVVDGNDFPVGILTRSDLLRHIVDNHITEFEEVLCN